MIAQDASTSSAGIPGIRAENLVLPPLNSWLTKKATSTPGIDFDDELGQGASACSIAQLLGYVVAVADLPVTIKSDLVDQLARALSRTVRTDGSFSLPYNRSQDEADWWDVAEIGAAAPSLLVAARAGVTAARDALIHGAAFLRVKMRLDDPGSVVKNADSDDFDIPNANAYAAMAFACAAEVSGDPALQPYVETIAQRLISQFGVDSVGWWPYSIGLKSKPGLGASLAYQATIVGCGHVILSRLPDGLQETFAGVLLAASNQVRKALSEEFDEDLESASWSRDWGMIPEVAWSLPRAASEGAKDDAFGHLCRIAAEVYREPADQEQGSSNLGSSIGRTPVSTSFRRLSNIAGSAILLDITRDSSIAVSADRESFASAGSGRYIARYSEPAARSSSRRWSFEPNAPVISLPNRVSVPFPQSPSDWERSDFEQAQSSLLWLHSMEYLPSLIESHGAVDEVRGILADYWVFMSGAKFPALRRFMTSYDHCVAVRIRALCMLAEVLRQGGLGVPESLFRIVASDVRWSREQGSVQSNNHGMMLCAAVLHAGVVFEDLVPSDQRTEAEQTLIRIVEQAFDENGVCLENTPSYHAFYLRFLESLVPFAAEHYPNGRLTRRLVPLFERANEALRLMVWHDGTMPPIGDSGAESSSVVSKTGVLFAPKAGMFVRKDVESYVCLRSGYSSSVHKHCDDSSISLRVGESELLLDAGMFNYDWQDERTVAVKSQRGHSGVFFERFDQFYPGTLYRPGSERVKSSLKRLDPPQGYQDRLQCRVEVDGTYRVERDIWFGQGRIGIRDLFSSPNGEGAVQRFLIPLSGLIVFSPGLLRYESADGGAWMEIAFDGVRSLSEYCGSVNPMKGWVSRSWNNIEPCRLIELHPRPGWSTMDVDIRFGSTLGAHVETATSSDMRES